MFQVLTVTVSLTNALHCPRDRSRNVRNLLKEASILVYSTIHNLQQLFPFAGSTQRSTRKKNNSPLLYSPKYLASSDKISWNLICNELLKERKKKTKTNLKRCRAELFRCTNNNFPFVIFKVYTCIIKWISKQLNLWAKGL